MSWIFHWSCLGFKSRSSIRDSQFCLRLLALISNSIKSVGFQKQAFVVVEQALSCVRLFATPWTAALQAPLSFTIPWSLLRFVSIELMVLSDHLILCRPLLLPPSIVPSIRVFSSESVLHIRWPKDWSFSFSLSPSNEYSGLISFRMDWLDLLAVQGDSQESSPTPQFQNVISSVLNLLYGCKYIHILSKSSLLSYIYVCVHVSLLKEILKTTYWVTCV